MKISHHKVNPDKDTHISNDDNDEQQSSSRLTHTSQHPQNCELYIATAEKSLLDLLQNIKGASNLSKNPKTKEILKEIEGILETLEIIRTHNSDDLQQIMHK